MTGTAGDVFLRAFNKKGYSEEQPSLTTEN